MKGKKAQRATATVVAKDPSSKQDDQGSSGIINTKVSRRTFIKGSVGAAAVVGVAAAVIGSEGGLQALQLGTPPVTSTPSDPTAPRLITINVNGKDTQVQVEPRAMLVDVLRDTMGLIAIKRSCNRMTCGGCTVLIDGKAVESCGYLAVRAEGHSVITPEIATKDPVVNALQQAAPIADMAQCGYCNPGIIMAATPLLRQNQNPSVSDIKTALSGNLCRCGNYMHIIDAVTLAAKTLRGGS